MIYDNSLHIHTEYSNERMLDCINKIPDIINRALELNMKTIAITDHSSISGHIQAIKLQKQLTKDGKDLRILLGDEIYLVNSVEDTKNNYQGKITKFPHFILIAKDEIGYRQLREIDSTMWENSWLTGKLRRTLIDKSQLENIIGDNKGHLIAQTACLGGELALLVKDYLNNPSSNNKLLIHQFITWCIDIFGKDNFAIEIQPSKKEIQGNSQIEFNKFAIQLAKAYDIRCVLTNDIHYLKQEDSFVHKSFLHARDTDRGETDEFYASCYFMTIEERYKCVKEYINREQFEQIINNGYELTKDCQFFDMEHTTIIPERDVDKLDFHIQHLFKDWYDKCDNIKLFAYSQYSQDQYLLYMIEQGFIERQQEFNEENIKRIDWELGELWKVSEILNDRMSAYYNLVDYIVDLCWEIGFVGVSRGSVTGFYTCYLIGIHQLNPIKWNLPAYRHLNSQRVSFPDVDLDTSARNRSRIVERLKEVFGYDNILNICTFRTETGKSAIKTLCRGLDISNEDAGYLASLVPMERGKQWNLHECFYGNPDKNRKPIQELLTEISKIDNEFHIDLKKMLLTIENLVSGLSTHASGIYIFKHGYLAQNGLKLTPRGDRITTWNMDDSDYCGGLKYDSLTTECQDKLEVCTELLLKYHKIENQHSIRATYNKYLHPDVLDYTNQKMWDCCSNGEIIDLFQFITPVGGACIKKIQPHSLEELSNANSLMRIVADEGEQPIDKFIRYKHNIQLWYDELERYGITDSKTIKALESVMLSCYGVSNTQEDIMELSMLPEVSGFTLKQSDVMRKIVAKKKTQDIAKLHKEFYDCVKNLGNSQNVADYVWHECIQPQLSYSFSRNHVTPYSVEALQEMNLYYFYPHCYWNCATLTVNATSEDSNSISYGKIAKAIYRSRNFGVPVNPPSINTSDISFTPNESDNTILFGLGGISGINVDIAKEVIDKRPFTSFKNFYESVTKDENTLIKHSKIIKLIKAGCFDEFGDRVDIMNEYIKYKFIPKTTLTTSNLQQCINLGVDLPKDLVRVYNFKRYVLSKQFFYCKDPNFKSKKHYIVEEKFAKPYLTEHYLDDLKEGKDYYYENDQMVIIDKSLEKVLKPDLEKLKAALNDPKVIESYNHLAFEQLYKDSVKDDIRHPNVNAWSFDATSYYHYDAHELENIDYKEFNLSHFNELPEQPRFIERHYGKRSWRQYDISKICGTVVDRDDNKHIVYLLTPDNNVVSVKFNGGQYSWYKQTISEVNSDGTKTILDPSWFARGTLLMVVGYRNEDNFRAKRYKNTIFQHTVTKILNVNTYELQTERIGEDEEIYN